MGSSKRARSRSDTRPEISNAKLPTSSEDVDYNKRTPLFCLHHLQSGFDVRSLDDKGGQAQLALSLHKYAQMTWAQIGQSGRQKAGTEWIPKVQVKASIPAKFDDQDRFMVFRYNGKLPMVGVRINEVFHVLWVERTFGEVYDHGS